MADDDKAKRAWTTLCKGLDSGEMPWSEPWADLSDSDQAAVRAMVAELVAPDADLRERIAGAAIGSSILAVQARDPHHQLDPISAAEMAVDTADALVAALRRTR